ncbi:MAG: S8 family peptidase [Pyrinomonadaceae bacterium]
MARKHNYLLGNGERLTHQVEVPKGGGDKNPPYPFPEARRRSTQQAQEVARQVQSLPDDACPGGEVVLSITMHPRYVSKSDFPSQLFSTLGLRSVGTKTTKVSPDNWGIDNHPDEAATDQIFVAGKKDRIVKLDRFIDGMTSTTIGANDLSHVENISFPSGSEKVKGVLDSSSKNNTWMEVVLHNSGRVDILRDFAEYASNSRAQVDSKRSRTLGGLTFVPVLAPPSVADSIAKFSFLRVLRSMPMIRPVPMSFLRKLREPVLMPDEEPLASSCRALIFDGGIPVSEMTRLGKWVTLIEPSSLRAAVPEFERHGLAVTSAFLFGPIIAPASLNRPICPVDHVRVIDEAILSNTDPYYYDILDRMLVYFDEEGDHYDLVNLSLGPPLPVDDDDVTLWTAEWDTRLSKGDWIVSVAAGNDGDKDHASGNNRIQPPSDGVNVLTVGACDKSSESWRRASYSCVGPGRRPGYRKPDGLAFGGSDLQPFQVLCDGGFLQEGQGTSLAAPYALRLAASVRAQLGSSISPLAIRALMIHRASNNQNLPASEIGWGRFEIDPDQLITCDDNEVLVIYQGELTATEYLRAPIPIPVNSTRGMVEIEATLLISTEIDSAHVAAYTRRGVDVFFRPHADKYGKSINGKIPEHPKTASFLSAANMYGKSEVLLRENGFKWEPCRRSKVTMRSSSLKHPCFDIYHHHRAGGVTATTQSSTKYALIVTVRSKQTKDFYNQVVRAYANILIPMQPQVRIEVGR